MSSLTVDDDAPAHLFARNAVESLPDLVCYVLPDRRYRFVNQGYRQWFGNTAPAMSGRRLPGVLGEAGYRLVEPYLDRAFAGEPTTFTGTLPLKFGPPRHVEVRLVPDLAEDGKVQGLFTTVRDINHRERILQEILSILDGMEACFLALDRDSRVVFVNAAADRFQAASELAAYASGEPLVGKRLFDLNPGCHGGALQQAFERVRDTGEPQAFEFSSPVRPDRIVDAKVFPTPSGLIAVSYIDITERRRAEDELRREEERLRVALQAGGMAAFEHDALTGQTWFSENAAQVLGRDPSAVRCTDIAHPEDQELIVSARDQVLRTGEPWDLTVRWPSPVEGEWRWMNFQANRCQDSAGRPVRLVGVVRDVTRAHMADELLRSANLDLQEQVRSEVAEKLKAVLDRERFWMLSRDLYAVVARGEGRLRGFNAAAWKAVLGYEPEQLVGRSLRDIIYPDDLEPTLAAVASLDRVPMVEFDYRIRHADGGWRWLSWKVISDGELCYATARDVTEEKAREEHVRRAQKLEALGQLTGGVAHDFNNLLTVIMGALDLMERRPHDSELRERLISAALVAAKRGERLNKQLLGFARRQAAHQEYTVPSRRIEEMAPLIGGALGDAIALALDTEGETRGVMADPAQLEVAVLNLVVNARDAMPGGGSLRITIRAAGASELRRLSLPSGDFLVVDVSDTGTGMSEEVLGHVFEPFFTTKEVGKGSGLGLAQVYGFARQCGGATDIQTQEGSGSTVSLYLPVAAAPAVDDELEDVRPGAGLRKRILLVEDDTLVGAVTESMLVDMGHMVARAEDAAGARDALARAEFDLLFTDVRMPGGCNGVQLAREATAARPDLKVLLCSGWTDDELDAEALDPRFPLLEKPFDAADLARALGGVLAG
jgi:PAS domain S-box-containing protein